MKPNEFLAKRSDKLPSVRRNLNLSSSNELQPPMKFNTISEPERVAQSIIRNGQKDVSPSKLTLLGSDIRVMDLRPNN
jgi:hypothetical protein